LWRSVRIQWESLSNISWRNTVTKRQIENLKYVRSIRFCDKKENPFPDFYHDGCSTVHHSKKNLEYFERFLSYFNADIVENVAMSRGGELIIQVCRMFPNLRRLHLQRMVLPPSCAESRLGSQISNQISEISRLEHLEEFQWDSVYELSDEYQEVLFSSGALRNLEVLNTSTLSCQADLPRLNELKMKRIVSVQQITFLSSVASSLRNLDLSKTYIRDEFLLRLTQLQNLQYLSVGDCNGITDVGVEHISKMSSLKFLDIGDTAYSQDGILHLQNLSNLKGLIISCHRIKVSDAIVPFLMGMTALVYLDITSREEEKPDVISVDGVQALSSHPSLKKLATFYKKEMFQDSCGHLEFVKSQHSIQNVYRNGTLDMIESRSINPDGWRISTLEHLIT